MDKIRIQFILVWIIVFVFLGLKQADCQSDDSPGEASDKDSSGAVTEKAGSSESAGAASMDIPGPAGQFVQAVKNSNLDSLLDSFDSNAVLVEGDRKMKGIEAIYEWAAGEVIGGKLVIEQVTPRENGVDMMAEFIPYGWEQGLRTSYKFDFKKGKIYRANIQIEE
jgi:hypothetical protein